MINLRSLKVFAISFGVMFLAVALFYAGVHSPLAGVYQEFKSPISKSDPFDVVRQKLIQKENKFIVKQERGIIPIAQAYSLSEFDSLNAYIVVDATDGEVILEKNLDNKLPFASITKVMTAIVVLDLAAEDEYFEVSERAAGIEPTKIGVVAGQKMKVGELIHASLITSANDATEVLKEGIDQKYGKGTFIKAMNEKGRLIGLKNSQFTNPQGFDNREHYSSVEDITIFSKYALDNYPLISAIVSKEYQFLPEDQQHKQFDLYNWNGLLGTYPGAYGIKIGNTGRAGNTTVVAAKRNGKDLMAVVLGAEGVLERDLLAAKLLDLGFEQKYGLVAANITEKILKEKYSSWKYWN